MKRLLVGFSVMAAAMFLSLFLLPNTVASAKDTKAPAVDENSITLSNKTPQRLDTITISIKITDDSKIVMPTVWIKGAGVFMEHGNGVYNSSTGKYDFVINVRYFGTTVIDHIWVADVYGNTMEYYNNSSDAVSLGVTQGIEVDYIKYKNLSKGNINVSTGVYKKETVAPFINLSSFTVSNSSPKKGADVNFKVKMSDSSPIAYTYVYYAYASACLASEGKYNSSSGYYEYPINCSSYGKIEPIVIYAEDAFGNKISYCDKKQSFARQYPEYFSGDEKATDLSKGNIFVKGGNGDITPPKLILSSFKIEKIYIPREKNITISFKIEDDSEIDLMTSWVNYSGMGGDGSSTSLSYNKKTGRYEILAHGEYYGTHQITSMFLCDVNGNKVHYFDRESEIVKAFGWIEEEAKNADLTATTYYVGLENRKTGTFASNSTMDKTSKLKVGELEEKGGKFNKLAENGYNVKGYYEVKVKGSCDMSSERTKVCFDAPKGFKNGDRLRIRHLLSDGSVQTQNARVVRGKVRIDVKEFSPFMVEVRKSKDKNLFKRKGVIYQVTGKKTVKVVGASSKKIKSLNILAKVKANKVKYSVTEINAGAFKNYKKLKKVTFGKNIKKIGKEAFYNCKRIKTLVFITNNIQKGSVVGKNAFKGVSKNAIIKANSALQYLYVEILKNKGLGK